MADRWEAVVALADRSRRALYDYVRRQGRPICREEAAAATRMSRGLAAFHLDKLVAVGLLHAGYEPAPDRPRGRGRAPKVYQAAGDGVAVTLPTRRYELIAGILADAVAMSPGEADTAAQHLAGRRGYDLGRAGRGCDVLAVLAGCGFEPEPDAGGVRLRNCPFHALATRQPALVCGLTERFVAGVLAGMGDTGLTARLAPCPGACCVRLLPATAGTAGPTGTAGTAGPTGTAGTAGPTGTAGHRRPD